MLLGHLCGLGLDLSAGRGLIRDAGLTGLVGLTACLFGQAHDDVPVLEREPIRRLIRLVDNPNRRPRLSRYVATLSRPVRRVSDLSLRLLSYVSRRLISLPALGGGLRGLGLRHLLFIV